MHATITPPSTLPDSASAHAHAGSGTSLAVDIGPLVCRDDEAARMIEHQRLLQKESRRLQQREALAAFVRLISPPLLGFALFILFWHGIASVIPALPTPSKTWHAALKLFADPFYSNGPNDQGIGWNILSSLARVVVGFGLAALIGIPAGFVIGRFRFFGAMMAPSSACCVPCRRWPGYPSVYCCSKQPTRRRSGRSSSARSGR